MDDAARTRLEAETRYDPAAVEPAMFARWQEPRAFEAEPDAPGEPYAIARAAAERHRLAAHGPRAQRHDPGPAHPPAPHAGAQRALAAAAPTTRASPRRAWSSACSRERGHDARGARARGVRASACGSGGSETGAEIIEQFKRLGCSLDYRARALHDGRRLRARGARGLRAAAREGLPLPRQPPRQLVRAAARPRSPTSRSSTARSTTCCTTSPTPSRAAARS